MNCPTCKRRTLSGHDQRGDKGIYCPNCERFIDARTVLKGSPPLPYEESEPDVVTRIVVELKFRGYTVLRVQQGDARRAGSDRGVPDLLVAVPGRGNEWRGLEVKKRTGQPTPEQAQLARAGLIAIVRSPEEALEAMRDDI